MTNALGLSLELFLWTDELLRLGNEAVAEAQEESRRLGVPNVYCFGGRIYYETPSGELSLDDPYKGPSH